MSENSETLHDVQLADSEVPYIYILDTTGGIHFRTI